MCYMEENNKSKHGNEYECLLEKIVTFSKVFMCYKYFIEPECNYTN